MIREWSNCLMRYLYFTLTYLICSYYCRVFLILDTTLVITSKTQQPSPEPLEVTGDKWRPESTVTCRSPEIRDLPGILIWTSPIHVSTGRETCTGNSGYGEQSDWRIQDTIKFTSSDPIKKASGQRRRMISHVSPGLEPSLITIVRN
jgi:hypothetical protein